MNIGERIQKVDGFLTDRFSALLYRASSDKEVVTSDGKKGIVVKASLRKGTVFIDTGNNNVLVYPGRHVASPEGGGLPVVEGHIGKPISPPTNNQQS